MANHRDTDLDRPIEQILDDVRSAALQNTSTTELKIGIVVIPFATLLVKLSKDAEATTQTIRRFTQWLFALTFALLFLTVALLVMQGYQLYQYDHLNDQRTEGYKNSDQKPNPSQSN